MSENCAQIFKIFERTSTTIAPVGPACRVRIWRQHEWRDWFWAAEATIGKVADSTITRKWKWWFVNGWNSEAWVVIQRNFKIRTNLGYKHQCAWGLRWKI